LVLLFGRRISSPRRILFRLAGAFAADPPIWCFFVWPAHSPPSRHRFGVVTFGRRIPRQAATDLVLFHLAGAFPANSVSSFAGAFAANPPIWCCSIWLGHPLLAYPNAHFSPAHPLAAPPSLFWPAHSFATPPLLSAGVFIRRAALLLLASAFICHAALLSAGVLIRRAALLLPACAFIRHAALAFGRRIYSPCPSPFFAGASPRRATIAIFRRRIIPSPCLHHLSR
jgi:hypothetical protein